MARARFKIGFVIRGSSSTVNLLRIGKMKTGAIITAKIMNKRETTAHRIDQLMPWNWKAAGAAAACVVGAGEGMPAPRQVMRLLGESRLDAEWDAVRVRLLERLRAEFQSEDAGRTSGGWNEASA